MSDEYRDVRNQLSEDSYNVRPDPPLSADFGLEPVREELDRAEKLAVFLLGGVYDRFVEDQIGIAAELGKPIVFRVHSGKSRNADQKQKDLLIRVERSRDESPKGSEVLGGASVRQFLDRLSGVFRRQGKQKDAASRNGAVKVYLIYDSTLADESQAAARVGDMLREKRVEVRTERDGEHEQLMRSSNGLLLLRAVSSTPDNWLKLSVRELSYAQEMYQRDAAFDVKAALVAEPARIGQAAGVDVLPYSESHSYRTP